MSDAQPSTRPTRFAADSRFATISEAVGTHAPADVLAPLSRALLFAHAGARIPDGWDPLVLNEEEGRVFDAVEKALRDAGADFGARFPFRAGWRDNVESMAAEIMLLRLRLRDTETTPPVVAGRVVEEKPNV